jgi:outer membrane protein assembly factor BamB
MKQCKIFIPVAVLLLIMAHSCAQNTQSTEDWPQYLGPNRNSTSDQKGILRSWPENGPEVLWTVDVGIGFGGPVVKNGKVYLLDRDDKVGDIMRCFDFSNGKELWKFSYDAPGSVMFPGSRSVPAVDGNYVYSCGHNGDLYCIDINTHKPVWNKNIWTEFGGKELPIWAITQCPLVYGDLIILLSQAPEAGVVAYNKLTGELVWKTRNLVNESYASPSVVKIDGEDHIVVVISSTNPIGHRELPQTSGNIVGIEPLTGEILWEYNEWVCHISVPSAVDAGNNKVLVAGGYELGTVMIEVKKQADGSYGTTEIFRTEEFGDHTKPPLLIDGYFYAQYGTNRQRDGLSCMSMDGQIMWKTKRSPDFNKGSMIFVDGLIIATDGAKSLYLIEPDPSGYKPLASAELLALKPGDEQMARMFATQNWAPIALSDGKLLIRDQSRLMCVRVAQ